MIVALALLAAQAAASPAGDPGIVSGSASPASRGGAGAVDPDPGTGVPVPSIVGGATPSRSLPRQAGARTGAPPPAAPVAQPR